MSTREPFAELAELSRWPCVRLLSPDRGVLVRNSRIGSPSVRGVLPSADARLLASSPRAPSPEVITAAGGATLRRDLVNVPARFGAPARKPVLHLPAHWPSQNGWETLCPNVIGYHHPTRRPEPTVSATGPSLAGVVDLPEGEVRG
jgi:hypothetical protein